MLSNAPVARRSHERGTLRLRVRASDESRRAHQRHKRGYANATASLRER